MLKSGRFEFTWVALFLTGIGLPRPGRAEPSPPTGPASAMSLRAAPAWFTQPGHKLLDRAKAYAPVATMAEALFSTAPSKPAKVGVIESGALVCQIDMGKRHFDEHPPFASLDVVYGDLSAAAGVGPDRKHPPGWVALGRGPEDGNRVTVLMPVVDLKPGQVVWLRVVDRDVQFDDLVAVLKVPYRGELPLNIRTKPTRGSCRLVPPQALEAALTTKLARADEALERLRAKAKAEVTSARGKGVDDWLAPARDRLAQAAALVGWADPRIRPRIQTADALAQDLTAAFQVRFQTAIEGASETGWSTLADGQIALRIERVVCGRKPLRPFRRLIPFFRKLEKDACAVVIGARNLTDRPVQVDHDSIGPIDDLVVIDPRGQRSVEHIEGRMRGQRVLKLKGAGELILGPGAQESLVISPRLQEKVLLAPRLPLLLVGQHKTTITPLGPSAFSPMDRGRVRVRLVDLDCGRKDLEQLAEEAWVFKSRRPVCLLRLELENTSEQTLDLAAWSRELSLLDRTGKKHRVEGRLLPSDPPKRQRGPVEIEPGQTGALLLLISATDQGIADLRIAHRVGPHPVVLKIPAAR